MKSQPAPAHIPVMLEIVMRLLACRPGGIYVDGTVGGGGYSEAILQDIGSQGRLIGLDWDEDAIARVKTRLEDHQDRLTLRKASFAGLPAILRELGIRLVDGIVLDLGVSSYQLEDASRGFSFVKDGPLDMRMSETAVHTAAELINTLSEKELVQVVHALGEERWARRIVRAIIARRRVRPFSRTGELADLVASVVPRTPDSRRIHPATRTFQALRIAVNQELEALRLFLGSVLDVLHPGGRLCIVAFHSLEDRIVKEHFKNWSRGCRCPSNAVVCRCGGKPMVRLLTKKALRAGQEEIAVNPRARSARLRAVEKHGEVEDER